MFALDGSNDADSRKDVDIAAYLGGQCSQNPYFEGMNRRFQAKRVKNTNFHIFKAILHVT